MTRCGSCRPSSRLCSGGSTRRFTAVFDVFFALEVEQEASKYIKQENQVKDPYIREALASREGFMCQCEVLRLWPIENKEGMEHVKNCAWVGAPSLSDSVPSSQAGLEVEGLDANLFTGRNVMVQRVAYDASHNYVLHCSIAKRQGEGDKEQGPPYRLTTCWQWQEVKALETSPVPGLRLKAVLLRSFEVAMTESLRLDSRSRKCCVPAAEVVQRVW